MKLLNLKMKAFGPYPDVQTVDFTAFGNSPMFLINGPTGAGKSTILDAICFAFYGTTSDKAREASGMRNALAGSSVLTEVELTFELADQRWKVRRIPHQMRAKARGEGHTEQKPEGQLYSIDEQGDETVVVAKKQTEVTEKIVELTGLNDEQFRQVMVLPQGQFRALLLAKSNEREDILSTLFGTSIYKKIEQRLKDSASDIRLQSEAYKSRVTSQLAGVEVNNQAGLKEKISLLKPQIEEQKKITLKFESKFEQALELHASSKELISTFIQLEYQDTELGRLRELEKFVKQKQRFISKNEKAKSIAKHQDALIAEKHRKSELEREQKELDAKLIQLRESLNELEKQKVKADEKIPEIEKNKLHLARLLEFSGIVENLNPQVSELKKITQKNEVMKTELAGINSPLSRLRRDEKKHSELAKELQQELQGASEVKAQSMKLEHIYEQHITLCHKMKDRNTRANEVKQFRSELAQQKTILNETQKQLQSFDYQWHMSQAAILARSLSRDVPCPVCGSTKHPVPAEHSGTLVDKEQVDTIREKLRGHERDHQLLEHRMAASSQQVTQLEQDIKKLRVALGNIADQTLKQTEKQLEEGRRESLLLDEKLVRLRATEGNLSDIKINITKYEKQHDLLENSVQIANELSIKLKAELETSLKNIPERIREPSVLRKEYSNLKDELDREDQEYAVLVKKLEFERQQYQKIFAKHETLVEQITWSVTNIERFESIWENTIRSSDFLDENEFMESVLTDQDLQRLKKEVEEHMERLAKALGAREQLQKTLDGRVKPDMDEATKNLEKVRAERDSENKTYNEAENNLNQLIQLDNSLSVITKEHELLQEKYGVVGRLSDIAGGQPPARVNFQRFVLGVLLDDVLLEASTRLNAMTLGRYELRRRGGVAGNKVTGLDLDIMDSYTGQERPVSTLSGGESFLAALSLALGLSDVVQAYSGGIRLDTLFIDEGFGSLDPEALDLAVQTLVDLQSRGRMIGVISHVEQMKEQIPKRIDIKTGISGSQLSLVCGGVS